ncbi:MAG TPA: hypothetical protein VGL94_17035 [Ktedonobacteraceae bacterium]
MPKYIFLDTWVLSDYTKAEYVQKLENFIKSNDYTIVFSGLSMAESYNPGWQGGGIEEQGARVASFLGNQHCVIVRPEKVQKFEGHQFPGQVDTLPIEMDLDTIDSPDERVSEILKVLRRDPALLDEGIDIEQWCREYEAFKKQWLTDVQKIIENSVKQGYLIKTRGDRYKTNSEEKREEFLRSLDWRLANQSTYYSWQDTSIMRGIRFTNLCLWHHYISPPPNQIPKKSGSDIGDLFQLSLLPYCNAFTVDTKMAPTVKLALEEFPCSCQILTHNELKAELQIT